MTQLQSLLLNQNGFNHEGMKYLVEVIPQLENLSTLSLARNSMGDEAISILVTVFHTLPRLVDVNIGDNNFGEIGMHSLSVSLKKLKTLSTLDVKFAGLKEVPGMKGVKKSFPSIKTSISTKSKATTYLLRPLSPTKRLASRLESRPRPVTVSSHVSETYGHM
eukprot:CAMPEP_0196576134 /NCGR_PEP_ID=MMETSP1081-20130531/5476_1 /TAXON_ID=36882 /ORGANISM="Pyramimonas amylifera, Strain CCMP720" /LENGTH=162 /DNA_ID=CAMNT_0041894663 /DNA_START=1 /DNA_END=489 /DNA_ORIENTATION=-